MQIKATDLTTTLKHMIINVIYAVIYVLSSYYYLNSRINYMGPPEMSILLY